MALPQALIIRYFQLIDTRQHTEAQRELQRVKEKMTRTEWNHGYYRALLGMLLAQRHNGNQYPFLTNLDSNDRQALRQFKNDFQVHIQSRFAQDYDRGYFTAWADYMRLLLKKADEAKPPVSLEHQSVLQAQTDLDQHEESAEATQSD